MPAESAGDLAHLGLLELCYLPHGFVDCRDHEILEHIDIVRIDYVLIDGELCDLLLAVDGDFDRAATGSGGHFLFLELRLSLFHLSLHGLELPELLLHISAASALSVLRLLAGLHSFSHFYLLYYRVSPLSRA